MPAFQVDPNVASVGEMDGIGPVDPDPEANTRDRYQFVT